MAEQSILRGEDESLKSPEYEEVLLTEDMKVGDEKRKTDDDQEIASCPPSRDLIRASQSTVSSIEPARGGKRDSRASSSETNEERLEKEYGSISAVKSPLSQRRISTSSLDEVSLIDELPPPKESSPNIIESTTASIMTRFSRSSTASSQSALNNASITQKSITSTPASKKDSTPGPAPMQEKSAPTVRRSPFSWLSRASAPKEAPPPKETPKSRRATNASMMSTSSTATSTTLNSELLLARIEANKELVSKADVHEKEELLKGTDRLRENFRRIREREAITDGYSAAKITSPSSTAGNGGATEPHVGSQFTELSGEADTAPVPTSAPTTFEDPIDWDLWQAVVEDPYKVASTRPTELNQAIQAGIPQTIRGTVWQSMAQSKSLELENMYREVIALGPQATAIDARPLYGTYWPPSIPSSSSPGSSRLGSPKACPPKPESSGLNVSILTGDGAKKTVAQLEKIIKKDLGERTSFGKYKVNQKALLNVCKAYALFDPQIGYTQGMTFVATPLLMNMTEEEAFCLFVKLMCKYNLRSMFQEKMKGLELRLYQFDRLLEDVEPRLSVHLKRQGIESSLYAAQWFLTLFTYKFPLQLVLRVYDLLFSEGVEGAVLKFGIVLMKKNTDILLEKDFESLGPFLKEKLFDVYLDSSPSANSLKEAGFFGNGGEKEVYRANIMVQDACSVKITREMLLKYESEWNEAERLKRMNEMELEQLKHSNAALASRVKKLEEELELVNKEHIDLLNGMVVKNMENSHLSDENAQLLQQVEELKQIVEKQPMEVEAKFKAELDRLMERQLEMHNENQALEEQMLEMQEELISTKMSLAEVSSKYDVLTNKWRDLKKAIGD
ncbi:rab-GTPase-TBC domain-containing protein [Kalaharituber pfeilii]|nr:rab-GTPase-TBC domain-containing protein [Kalaharituber pfeilii]